MGKLRHPTNINEPLQEAAWEKFAKYLADYANDRYMSFLPAAFSTSGRIDAEFLCLLFYHAQDHCFGYRRIGAHPSSVASKPTSVSPLRPRRAAAACSTLLLLPSSKAATLVSGEWYQ